MRQYIKTLYIGGLACLFAIQAHAQVKLQGAEFQLFTHQFPAISLPFSLGENEVIKLVERDEYLQIERRYAEKFLGIKYNLVNEEATDETPRKVPHYIAHFKAHQVWHILIYYWYDSPPSRELRDNFELAIFDKQGGKVALQVIAGIWGKDTTFARILQVGKDIIIETKQTQNGEVKTVLYKITPQGTIIPIP